jgi:hypothetical protein
LQQPLHQLRQACPGIGRRGWRGGHGAELRESGRGELSLRDLGRGELG